MNAQDSKIELRTNHPQAPLALASSEKLQEGHEVAATVHTAGRACSAIRSASSERVSRGMVESDAMIMRMLAGRRCMKSPLRSLNYIESRMVCLPEAGSSDAVTAWDVDRHVQQ